jgi:hypothetical protein
MNEHEQGPQGWAALGASWRGGASAGESGDGSAFDAIDVDELKARSASFARTIRHRNLREVVAGVVVIASGLWIAWTAWSTLVAIGGVAMAIGAASVTTVILLRARNIVPPPPDAPTPEIIAYERAQLERQARLLERVWAWYLAPLLPGIVAIYVDVFLRAPHARPRIGAMFLGTLAFFVFLGWLNARAARRLRSRMEILPRADEPSNER